MANRSTAGKTAQKLLTCDHCGAQDHVMHRQTSRVPERNLCEDCYNRNFRFNNLHTLGLVYAWSEYGEEGGW